MREGTHQRLCSAKNKKRTRPVAWRTRPARGELDEEDERSRRPCGEGHVAGGPLDQDVRSARASARTRRSLRERGVTLDVEVRLELLERLVAEALHAAQIRGALEPAVLLAPGHDPLGLRGPDRRQHHELFLS